MERSYYQGKILFQEMVPLYDAITTHMDRKAFITLSLSKGIRLQDVMKMAGHTDYKSMKPYIAISQQHLKELAKKWEI